MYRTGRRRGSGGLTVFLAPGRSPVPEVGVVAGRKVGNAVKRNKAKRRLREAARRVDLEPTTAYVLVASPDVLAVSFSELVASLSSLVSDDEGTGNEDER